jgi:hypothetical protein
VKATYLPSGENTGSVSDLASLDDRSGPTVDPVELITYSWWFVPPRVESKMIWVPSGDQSGSASDAVPTDVRADRSVSVSEPPMPARRWTWLSPLSKTSLVLSSGSKTARLSLPSDVLLWLSDSGGVCSRAGVGEAAHVLMV